METKVQMWGNSLALRIPKAFAQSAGLRAEGPVEMALVHGQIVLTPLSRPAVTLEGLLAGITEENLHGEISTGLEMGNEMID